MGGCTQVKQLFEDEIIVWLHPFTPMAHRGLAKQHNGLRYLISASASPCNDDFFYLFIYFFLLFYSSADGLLGLPSAL